MSNLITLAHYHAESAQYHTYTCTDSSVSQMPHYHDYFQISLVTAGGLLHRQGSDSVSLQPGDAFIVPPGFVHRVEFIAPDTSTFVLAFQDSLILTDHPNSPASRFLRDLQRSHDSGNISLRLTPDASLRVSLKELLECLSREQRSPYPPELSAAPSLISAIVYLLAQCYYQNTSLPRQPWSSQNRDQLLRRCVVYLDTHFTQELSADDIAKQFGLSRSSLSSAFQQHTGLPLHKYIAQKRIDKAQMLIRTHPDLPLSEVAARVGYEDNSTFYRNFHRITGMSPAKYRDLCQID